MANNYCIIMAGGIGSRFWPVSTSDFPKQFHDILGTGESLIQQTFRRLKRLTDADKIMVVTHQRYADLVAEQLPEMPRENIILEPARRNTAPCITYAAYRIQALDPSANLLIAPSDHLITNEAEFERICRLALDTAENSEYLLTLGIKPHRPDTGYGYIQFVEQEERTDAEVKLVKTFTEKPNLELAEQFLESGDFLWNSGLFVWSLASFKRELAKYQTDLYQSFEAGAALFGSKGEEAFIKKIYPSCANESIDYGLMEKSSQVYVIPADFGWSDLGTWGSLYEELDTDENSNAIVGKRVLTYDSKGNMIHSAHDKVTVIEGLQDYIVIDTPQSLLITKMSNEQLIKTFVSDIKLSFGDKEL